MASPLDNLIRRQIDTSAKRADVSKQLRDLMNLNDDKFNLDEHFTKVDLDKGGILDNVRHLEKPGRGEESIASKGQLADYQREIERMHERKGDREARLSEYTDTTKGKGRDAKREFDQLNKDLERAGKEAQRHAGETLKELRDKLDELKDNHRDVLDHFKNHRDNLQDAVRDLKIDKNTGAITGLEKLHTLDDITFETGGKKYTIKQNEIIHNGTAMDASALKALTDTEINAIRDRARTAIGDHISDQLDIVESAHQKAVGVMQDKISHVEGVQKELHTKTGIGEWNGKTASKTTPGGVQAASKGIMTEAEYMAKTGFGEKTMADINANWKAGGITSAQVLIGGLGVGKGLWDVLTAGRAMMSNDPEDKEKAGMGTLLIGLGEIAGGTLIAKLGGANRAMGKA